MTTLVLLPGLDGTEVLLEPLVTALPNSLRPLVVTYPTEGDNGYPTLLARVRHAVAGLPQYYVLGWSFSGPLALMLAAAEPEKVRGVILSASFVRAPTPLLGALRATLVPPAIWGWRAARRLPLWLLRPRSDPLRRAKSETWRRAPARVVAARLRAVAAVEAGALLQACRAPVLYLAASADGIVPARNGDEIVQLRPSVRRVTIAGAHLAMHANPQAAARAIGDFVAEVERSCHQAVTALREDRAASS